MKKFKNLFAVVLSLAMVLGMAMTTSAAGTAPKSDDSAKVEIKNVEKGATFTAYQIIDANYNNYGFTGYVWAQGTDEAGKEVTFTGKGEEAVVKGLTDDVITKLAQNPSGLTVKENFNPETDKLEAGTWMILVTPPATNAVKVYNPMIVSVFYTLTESGSNGDPAGGSVDANDKWELTTTNAYAKSSEIPFDKSLKNPAVDTEVKVGQSVDYVITTTIPSYSKEYYTDVTFGIQDKIINGLRYDITKEPVVTVNGTVLTKNTDYTFKYVGETEFEIDFIDSYVYGLADKAAEERAVTVEYSAIVTDDAVTKVGVNEATVNFDRSPGFPESKTDKEYVFSFALHGVFDKVNENNEMLPNATFTLFEADENGDVEVKWAEADIRKAFKEGEYQTGDDGEIKFKGLDGDKTYYLQETAAPNKYSINDTIYEITFEFNKTENYEGGDVTYTIKVKNNKNNDEKSFNVTYGETTTVIDTSTGAIDDYGNEAVEDAILVINTMLNKLPSTGGIGTTIFTIGGCIIMVAAAGLFFASRRKSSK